MASIHIEAESSAELQHLLSIFASGSRSKVLKRIATAIEQGNDELLAELEQIRLSQTNLKESIMISLDQIIEKVQEQRTTVDSVAAFITGLEQRLGEALQGADPATQEKLQTVMDELTTQKQALADAIDNDPGTPAHA